MEIIPIFFWEYPTFRRFYVKYGIQNEPEGWSKDRYGTQYGNFIYECLPIPHLWFPNMMMRILYHQHRGQPYSIQKRRWNARCPAERWRYAEKTRLRSVALRKSCFVWIVYLIAQYIYLNSKTLASYSLNFWFPSSWSGQKYIVQCMLLCPIKPQISWAKQTTDAKRLLFYYICILWLVVWM